MDKFITYNLGKATYMQGWGAGAEAGARSQEAS